MEISDEEKNNAYKRVSDDLRDGGKIFGTDIVKEVTLDQYLEAFSEADAIASEGKILVKIGE